MKGNITRRDFIKVTGGGLAMATVGLGGPFVNSAHAAKKLSVVDWGPPYIDCSKKVAASWGKGAINWTLHSGGAASVLPKIKASWPNPPYDLLDIWSPVFISMVKEGWAETVTLENCPNLKDIPKSLISKDKNGNWKSIPRGLSGQFWVASENCPIEIKNIEDLLNPKMRGQILWPNPTLNTNTQVIMLAIARGGDQYNLKPGWDFLKELIKSGNIGRISANTSDVITSFETGETSFTFVDQGTTGGIKGTKIQYLTKTHESLKTLMFTSGWMVLSSSKNKQQAFDYANYSINKENSELYHKIVGEVPANSRATHGVDHLKFSDEELGKYMVEIDWDHAGAQLDGWNKYFEREIVPLF